MRFDAMMGMLAVLVIAAAPAMASHTLVPFQANLLDDEGNAIQGEVTISFAIYDVANGGSVLWVEEHEFTSVVDGRINVILGSEMSLDGFDFTQPRFLGITVGDQLTAVEMLPRHQLVPSFHAVSAEFALTVAEGAVGTSEIAEGAVGASEIAEGAVGASEIAADAVGWSEIAANAIGTTEIIDGSVVGADLAVGSVGNEHLLFNVWSYSAVSSTTLVDHTDTTRTHPFCSLKKVAGAFGASNYGCQISNLSAFGPGQWRLTASGGASCSMVCFGGSF